MIGMATPLSQPLPPGLTVGMGQQLSASLVNSFRVTAVAERLAMHVQPGYASDPTEFFGLCLSLARGIDFAVANGEVPQKAKDLPLLMRKVCRRKNDLFLQSSVMVLMISVKNACKIGWFSNEEAQELCHLADEVGNVFCSPKDVSSGPSGYLSVISTIMSRFYPQMKTGQILAVLEVNPGYEAYVTDFHISKNPAHSANDKIRLFVAQTENMETSACLISPQQVNFLLNGKGVERRTNVLMDPGPQLPTNVTSMLKYGTNLLQAVGQFNGHYVIAVAFMSMMPLIETPVLQDYIQSNVVTLDPDSDLIEGPSRVSLNCPISYTRIKIPVKGHSCKHFQCFDFSNFIDINSRRPSWRCPHCNQSVCYTDIRVDQNMVKVLREVGDNVFDVIISADGSWKAILDSNSNGDETQRRTLNCPGERCELKESSTTAAAFTVLDLTGDDDEMDVMDRSDIEDKKPSLDDLLSQPDSVNLTTPSRLNNANEVNQNFATQIGDDFWDGLVFPNSSVGFNASSSFQMGNGISQLNATNVMPSSVTTDAISPALGNIGVHGNPSLSIAIQNFFSGNTQLQHANSVDNSGYGSLQHIPRNLSRTPTAIPALPVPSQTPQYRSRTNLNNGMLSGSSLAAASAAVTVSLDVNMQQNFSRSHMNAHQGQSMQQQAAGLPNSTQLPRAYNLHQQQALWSHIRSPSPTLMQASSPLPQTQTWQRGAHVGVNNTAGIPRNQSPRFLNAAQQAVQMSRQPPLVPVQIPTSRAGTAHPANTNGIGAPAMGQRGNVAELVLNSATGDLGDLPSEQDWHPTGRMRGSLRGPAYSAALRDLIQPTQPSQVPRSPSNVTPAPISPQLQAFLANSRTPPVPHTQNSPMTEPASMSGTSGALP